MNLWLRSLCYYGRHHLGVVLGTLLSAMVLSGALLVGDSVDGSLRATALARLGPVASGMDSGSRHWLASWALAMEQPMSALLSLPGLGEVAGRQCNNMHLVGADATFQGWLGLARPLEAGEAVVNRSLASFLDLSEGDTLVVRIAAPSAISGDAPLAASSQLLRRNLRVRAIVKDGGLGRFGLQANQLAPRNCFVSRDWLNQVVYEDEAHRANVLLSEGPAEALQAACREYWQPDVVGLRYREVGNIGQLTSEEVYISPEQGRAAAAGSGGQGTLTYLVNSIGCRELATPYSFVLAVGCSLPDDQIVINAWLASQIKCAVGDAVTLKYFVPTNGQNYKELQRTFIVNEIRPMHAFKPERALAPEFPGMDDVDRCADWDIGLPLDEQALDDPANEAYWAMYRNTPKAIISLAAGQSMWSNRFGAITGIRWDEQLTDWPSAMIARYDPARDGFVVRPLRAEALNAVEQAMDFGGLFIAMSFFLIASALLLTALLFIFAVQHRSREMGALLAMGWSKRRVRRQWLGESLLLAAPAAIIGALLGMFYTRFLLWGLSRYWQGAVASAKISFYWSSASILIGAGAALLCVALTLVLVLRQKGGQPIRQLLQNDLEERPLQRGHGRIPALISGLLCLAAIGVVVHAVHSGAGLVATPFFAAGGLLLTAAGLGVWLLLGRLGSLSQKNVSIRSLALRNAGRRRGRSTAVVMLLASGSFMVLAVSSMRENLALHASERSSGTGGFAWFAESRFALPAKGEALDAVKLRYHGGDDASCLNLNRAAAVQVYGVPVTKLSILKAFEQGAPVWNLLNTALPEGRIPALVGDRDTLLWGLQKKVGDVLPYTDEQGRSRELQIVGTLPMRLSVFQGSMLISEQNFERMYPSVSGYQRFLVEPGLSAEQLQSISKKYSRYGFVFTPSLDQLQRFYAVESTYLSMFLALGLLGLLLGCSGMTVVVMRNVLERRREWAMLCVMGYSERQLRSLIWREHLLLLVLGLGIGWACSCVAMLPAWRSSQADLGPGALLLTPLLLGLLAAVGMALAVLPARHGTDLTALRNE